MSKTTKRAATRILNIDLELKITQILLILQDHVKLICVLNEFLYGLLIECLCNEKHGFLVKFTVLPLDDDGVDS